MQIAVAYSEPAQQVWLRIEVPEDATLEHIQPLSEGGSSHLENLAISHGRCNNQRHAKVARLS